ncbi:MAG: ribosome maturation factor RimM [Acidimicrobiales bacterium]
MLEVGRVARPHGLRGEVIVELTSNRPEQRLAPGSVLVSSGDALVVTAARPHQGRWIVSFAGFGDREEAEELRGRVLSAEPLDEAELGTLWVHELVGSEVFDIAGTRFGTVAAVEANPASDLLVLDDGRLVPLTFVTESGGGRTVIDPPAGLL